MAEENKILTEEESKVLFRITPEHRFKNALNALNDLDCDYTITFQGIRYERQVNRSYIGHNVTKSNGG